MQYSLKDYNPEKHDRFHAVIIPQPYAQGCVNFNGKDGEYSTVIRSRNTDYRGDVLICAAEKPVLIDFQSGCTLGMAELYEVKRVEDLTAEELESIHIAKKHKKKWVYFLRNPRRVIEMPINEDLLTRTTKELIFSKGDIIEYPKKVVLDKLAWKEITKESRKR